MFLELAEKQGRFENRVTYLASFVVLRSTKLRGWHLLERGQLNSASRAYFAPDTASTLNIDH